MTPEEIKKALELHAKWLCGETGGVQANFTRVYLTRPNLTGADLTGANFTRTDLAEAGLAGAKSTNGEYAGHAACYFDGHGDCGRQLLAIQFGEVVTLYCGCFKGTPAELKTYIASGPIEHRKSRTLALRFVLAALKLSKHQPEKITKKASKK